MPLTVAERAAFERDGFLLLDKYFTRDELDGVAASYAWFADNLATDGEVYDASAQCPEFLRIAAKRETAEIANALLGRDGPLYVFTARARIDRPHDERRIYGWHQEVFYSPPHARFVQTWAPLIRDTTVENGTIEVCPGSHRHGIAKQSWTEADGRATQIIVDPQTVARYPQRPVPMKLGQMMFFDSRLFHRSGRNTSGEVRHSLVGMYMDPASFAIPQPRLAWRGDSPKQWYDREAVA